MSAQQFMLADSQLEHLADLVAERLAAPSSSTTGLVSAAELAAQLGVSRSWVYQHSAALGAQRLGDGSRGRLRFDVETAKAASGCLASDTSHGDTASAGGASAPSPRPRRRRSPTRAPKPGSILGVRPRSATAGRGR